MSARRSPSDLTRREMLKLTAGGVAMGGTTGFSEALASSAQGSESETLVSLF